MTTSILEISSPPHYKTKSNQLNSIYTIPATDLHYIPSYQLPQQMANWDQLYDLEPLIHTPPTEPTSKQHSYITCEPYKRYDSDVHFDSPTWWDIIDQEEEAITRYKKFLRDQLTKVPASNKQEVTELAMTKTNGMVML
jgi:hypothetical protein